MNREGKEGDDVNANSLKAKAAKLREEVELLEQEAKRRRTPSSGTGTRLPEAAKLAPEPSQYNAIEDSVWQLSYRFSDRPEPRPDADDQRTGQQQPRKFYSGKLTLKFRSDGYTDVISQESLGSSTDAALVTKVWGWDLEKLNEDGKKDAAANVEKEFLLFSADFDIPSIDVKDGATKIISQRFYFQARQTKEKQTNIVSLSEGTVTVKQDIVQKSARWGLFSPAGILAQFRYVGDFVSKPVRIPEQNDSR
jgi:hypothetical protein